MSGQTPLLLLHLLGFAFGVGASTILDLRILRLLSGQAVTEKDVAYAELLGKFVRIGLALLWLSGLCILVRAAYVNPDLLSNPKLHAKIVIVVLLTFNGVLVERIALPLLHRQRGRPLFEGVSVQRCAFMLGCGVVSATSWYVPFVLGVARELNFGPSVALILGVYAALVASGVVAVLGFWHLFLRHGRARRATGRGFARSMSEPSPARS